MIKQNVTCLHTGDFFSWKHKVDENDCFIAQKLFPTFATPQSLKKQLRIQKQFLFLFLLNNPFY